MNLPSKPLALGFLGGVLGATAVLVVAFVAVPVLTAPVPAQQAPCDPHAAPPPPDPCAVQPPFGHEPPPPTDMFDHNNTAWVVYEFNTGHISGATVSSPVEDGDPSGIVPRLNEGVLDITNDPNRDAFFESTWCSGGGELPWRVDPWAARLVPV